MSEREPSGLGIDGAIPAAWARPTRATETAPQARSGTADRSGAVKEGRAPGIEAMSFTVSMSVPSRPAPTLTATIAMSSATGSSLLTARASAQTATVASAVRVAASCQSGMCHSQSPSWTSRLCPWGS